MTDLENNLKTNSQVFMCCFCGKGADDPVAIGLIFGAGDEGYQQWWCHVACFAGQLDEKAREFRPELLELLNAVPSGPEDE